MTKYNTMCKLVQLYSCNFKEKKCICKTKTKKIVFLIKKDK